MFNPDVLQIFLDFLAAGVAKSAVRPCPCPPQPTMNPFCLWIIMSARLIPYIESIRILKMELDVWDCENISWIAKSNLIVLLQLSGNVGCPLSLL